MNMQYQDKLLDPSSIDLTGDFSNQMSSVLHKIRLKRENVMNLKRLYDDLLLALQTRWPGCSVVPFGSIVTGLGIKGSDADCYVQIPQRYQKPGEIFVQKAKYILKAYPHVFQNVVSIPMAKVPIVKYFHVPTKTQCDVSFKNALGSRNTELIAFLFKLDERILPMAVVIKYWSKVHGLTGTNLLSSYSLIMLIIFYLQQIEVLPSVEWLQRECIPCILDHWNVSYLCDRLQIPPSLNTTSPQDLLGGFFKFYSEFDFYNNIVSPYVGCPLNRKEFSESNYSHLFKLYNAYLKEEGSLPLNVNTEFCIQDVFEHSRNCSGGIQKPIANRVKAHIQLASKIYRDAIKDDCQSFIKDLLTLKPNIQPLRYTAPIKVTKRTNSRKIKNKIMKIIQGGPRG